MEVLAEPAERRDGVRNAARRRHSGRVARRRVVGRSELRGLRYRTPRAPARVAIARRAHHERLADWPYPVFDQCRIRRVEWRPEGRSHRRRDRAALVRRSRGARDPRDELDRRGAISWISLRRGAIAPAILT